ncbi:hypothetical protein QBC42DRAFT_274631 [Cladorrhinum samala]|uniref:Extracellular membrane protein CFEM domain-containing protein n=1 Tax=Cladorrhinum samala TaxID=585594 RepID=A0AAV9HHK7_9PEZI|nr:hypothetical protein QBC42DRAFT_274631 [Cladorrhinum samala]
MAVSKHIRVALFGLALLFFMGRVEATDGFKFSGCISNCIKPSSCPPSKNGDLDGRCMCRAARDDFLELVLGCMNLYCRSDLRDFDDKFLEPMEDGCDDIDHDIPKSKIRAAESVGSSLLSLSSTVTLKTTLRVTATTTTASVVSSSAAEVTTTSLVNQITSSTQPTTSPPPRTSAPSGSNFIDTSPFSNPTSVGSQHQVLMSLLCLPVLVIGLVWR